jgi:hypothetical protein
MRVLMHETSNVDLGWIKNPTRQSGELIGNSFATKGICPEPPKLVQNPWRVFPSQCYNFAVQSRISSLSLSLIDATS